MFLILAITFYFYGSCLVFLHSPGTCDQENKRIKPSTTNVEEDEPMIKQGFKHENKQNKHGSRRLLSSTSMVFKKKSVMYLLFESQYSKQITLYDTKMTNILWVTRDIVDDTLGNTAGVPTRYVTRLAIKQNTLQGRRQTR
ncbi:hypothetical protein BDC45DRAFT_529767 [Circinella umbellata]|nr:hypothetical protein BDC45DRAFT_529767 [Circinella umbellata]